MNQIGQTSSSATFTSPAKNYGVERKLSKLLHLFPSLATNANLSKIIGDPESLILAFPEKEGPTTAEVADIKKRISSSIITIHEPPRRKFRATFQPQIRFDKLPKTKPTPIRPPGTQFHHPQRHWQSKGIYLRRNLEEELEYKYVVNYYNPETRFNFPFLNTNRNAEESSRKANEIRNKATASGTLVYTTAMARETTTEEPRTAAEAAARNKNLPDYVPLPPSDTEATGPTISKKIYIRRTEVLLNIWTDAGSFSKVDAMAVACSVLEGGYDDDEFRKPLDMRNNDEFNLFCSNLNDMLGLVSRKDVKHIPLIDYRIIWRVYGTFTNAIKNDTSFIGQQSSITSSTQTKSSSKSQKSKFKSKPRSQVANTNSMCQHEEFIHGYNSTITVQLTNPLKVFIITYGRFVELEKVDRCTHMKSNGLNSHMQKYYYDFSSSIPGTHKPLPNHLEIQLANTPNHFNLHQDKLSYLDSKIFRSSISPEEEDQGDKSLKEVYKAGSTFHSAEQSEMFENGTDPKKLTKRYKIYLNNIKKRLCLLNCRYDNVKSITQEKGFEIVDENELWNILWSDVQLPDEKFEEIREVLNSRAVTSKEMPLQKLNHFPGMSEVCKKDLLATNLNGMKKEFKTEYDFFPETWVLPFDISDVLYFARMNKNSTFICKPESGSQGAGIFLVRDPSDVNTETRVMICQLYIPRPLTIDGFKFDLRIYVLVSCCDPLRIYIYNEGIARFASVKYISPNSKEFNLDRMYMHLTNYSLNKHSPTYNPGRVKRKLSDVYKLMESQGRNVKKIKDEIDSIIVKTMIAAQPPLKAIYKSAFSREEFGSMCFEMLGFDILLDEKLKPFLLEVNHSPSLCLDLTVDEEVKRDLIKDTLSKIYLGCASNAINQGDNYAHDPSLQFTMKDSTRAHLTPILQKQFRHEALHGLNYRLIYPDSRKSTTYAKLLNYAIKMEEPISSFSSEL